MDRLIHYWTGYGNLCHNADSRRADAQCSAVKTEVTCPQCRGGLEFIEKAKQRYGTSRDSNE